jgi:tRNA G10  N-methylase Trm11
MLMGIEKIIGSDASHNAVDDSRKNILWMSEELGTRRKESGIDIFQNNVENISDKVKDVNVIVTEPYLGPPLRGHETQDQILQITNQLGQLYAKTFEEFEKILKKDGRVVIIFPKFLVHAKSRRVDIDKKIETLGFLRLDDGRFTYKREGQRVQREIRIYRKA